MAIFANIFKLRVDIHSYGFSVQTYDHNEEGEQTHISILWCDIKHGEGRQTITICCALSLARYLLKPVSTTGSLKLTGTKVWIATLTLFLLETIPAEELEMKLKEAHK